jgi:hypothetical protein
MIDPTSILLVTALLTFVVPAIFLVVLAIAAIRRNRGEDVGPRTAAALCLLGGLALGLFALFGVSDLLTEGPIVAAAALFVLREWRSGRRSQAGWILAGTALPWTVLWGFYAVAFLLKLETFAPGDIWPSFLVGAVPLLAGVVAIIRGDPAPPPPEASAPAGAPGSRSFGSVAAAIRGPGLVGPFGISEVAALVAFVAAILLVPFALPSGTPRILAFAIPAVIGASLATEAYIRAMPRDSRLAFEAFSWLGEWELKQAGMSAMRVPSTPGAARRWLDSHPERPDQLAIRAELLVLAGRPDEARGAADRLPAATPWERWVRTEAIDSIDWRSGGDGDLEGLRAAAADLVPLDGDDHLRAEVAIATTEVRRRMADGRSEPGDAAQPLIEVRKRLGARADGQVGRALRGRLFPAFLIASLVLGGILTLLGGNTGPLT